MNRRLPPGPLALRLAALAVLVAGGFALGSRLRDLPEDPHPGFARWYVAAWCVRAGLPAADLYRDDLFARRVESIAPASGLRRFPSWPPLSVAPMLPFTALAGDSARLAAACVAAALVVASLWLLGSLSSGRPWERAEWLLLVGGTFGSAPLGRALESGDPAPFVLVPLSIAAVAAARGRLTTCAVAHGLVAAATAIGIPTVIGYWASRGRRSALVLAGALLASVAAATLWLGFGSHRAWFERYVESWREPVTPEITSVPLLLGRLILAEGAPSPLPAAMPITAVLLAATLGLGVGLTARGVRGVEQRPGGEVSEGSFGAWTALSLLFAPVASFSLLLLAAIPLWCALRRAIRTQVSAGPLIALLCCGLALWAPLPFRLSAWAEGPALALASLRVLGLLGLWVWLLALPDLSGRASSGSPS